MRVIAGTARGRRLDTLPGPDTRPTLERVKEAMFSAVAPLLPGAAVLDLFAGSGQLGLEALSRGAASCVFVDSSPQAAQVVLRNAERLGFGPRSRVVREGAEGFLARSRERFDLLLLDPPYGGGFFPGLLRAAARVCAGGAVLMCESARDVPMPCEAWGLRLQKQYRYGAVQVCRYAAEDISDGEAQE